MCFMITDAQLWGVNLLTLYEFPVQGIQFGWAKAFLFIHLQSKHTKPNRLAIYIQPCNFFCNSHKLCKDLIYLNFTSLRF